MCRGGKKHLQLAQRHRQHVAMAPTRPIDIAIRPGIADEFLKWLVPSKISRQLLGSR